MVYQEGEFAFLVYHAESMSETEVKRWSSIVRSILSKRESAIFLALVGISVCITIVAPRFATSRNFYLVSRQISFVAIVAMGELFVILTAGIDLSVGSMVGFSGVIAGLSMAAGIPTPIALVFGLMAGTVLGLISGTLVAYVGITPFIVTLGMLSIARGAIWGITKGWPITEISKSFLFIARGELFGIPASVIIAGIIAIFVHIVLRYTIFGRRTFAIGGNEEATALSGINVKKIKLVIYGISGLLSSITGIMLVARFNSAQPSTGQGWELDAIAATVIGGTALTGGEGGIIGTFVGTLVMAILVNTMNIINVHKC